MASKNVVWPHPTEPRARKHRRTKKNDTFGGHIGKEPRLMNHTHTYIHIRSKVGSRKKRNTLTHVWNIQAKKERKGKLRKQEENMKKLLLEL